jgi:hypothetical protein
VPPFSSLPPSLFALEARERVLCAISIQSYRFGFYYSFMTGRCSAAVLVFVRGVKKLEKVAESADK